MCVTHVAHNYTKPTQTHNIPIFARSLRQVSLTLASLQYNLARLLGFFLPILIRGSQTRNLVLRLPLKGVTRSHRLIQVPLYVTIAQY